MKRMLLVLILFPTIGFSQYSNYYSIDHNVNANINKKVNVSGTVRNTITTIDYGALANANAQREANRLQQQRIAIEQAQYWDEKERRDALLEAQKALEIAQDPMKAHAYGREVNLKYNYQNERHSYIINSGFLSFNLNISVPHKSLFENIGKGRFENISTDGITTEILFYTAEYNYKNLPIMEYEQSKAYQARFNVLNDYWLTHNKPKKRDYKNDKDSYKKDLKRYIEVCDSLDNFGFNLSPETTAQMNHIQLNSMFPNGEDSAYCHKKEVVKRLVYGHEGFRGTLVWEDDYEIGITDNYISMYNGITYFAKTRYKADKTSSLTFEDLEGRRFYLSKVVDKTIASRKMSNQVYASDDGKRPKRKSYSNPEDFFEARDKYEQKLSRR